MRILVSLLIFLCAHASACVNTYEEDIEIMMQKGDPDEIAQTVQRLEAANATTPTLQSRNDLAVAYILSGKLEDAASLLTSLEKDHPGMSRTASNLGTALELLGKNKEALHWIEEGIARDPGDHEGTEWLHLKILEAKVALEKDPTWLETHNVIGADFGPEARPRTPSTLPADRFGRPSSLEEVDSAMGYQLLERLKFVTAPDPIVASLYRVRADIAHLRKSPAAADYYKAAKFFGAKDDLTKRREEQFLIDASDRYYATLQSKSRNVETESSSVWIIGAAVAALLSLVAVLVFRAVRMRSK